MIFNEELAGGRGRLRELQQRKYEYSEEVIERDKVMQVRGLCGIVRTLYVRDSSL